MERTNFINDGTIDNLKQLLVNEKFTLNERAVIEDAILLLERYYKQSEKPDISKIALIIQILSLFLTPEAIKELIELLRMLGFF